ncbi:hypothetical protein R2A130_2225 [Ahrensia sp. R2A130]|nr:hypothetical protein R2A130_2225 [Ahrensia sp. R2A130]
MERMMPISNRRIVAVCRKVADGAVEHPFKPCSGGIRIRT